MRSKTLLRGAFGIIIGFFFTYWATQNIDPKQMRTLFAKVDHSFIALTFLFYACSIFVRSFRWYKLLKAFISLTFFQVFKALLIGHAMNVILPARLGELFRIDFCKKFYGIARSNSLATVVYERVTDGVVVVSCLSLGALSLQSFGSEMVIQGLIFTAGSVFFLATLFLFYIRRFGISFALSRFPKIASKIDSIEKGVQKIEKKGLVELLFLTIALWFFEGATLWAIVRSLGISLSLGNSCLLLGVVSLSTLLPSAPGFLGTLQFAFATALVCASYEMSEGILAASIYQLFVLSTLAFIGLSLYAWTLLKTKPITAQNYE